jgi:tetratricopeptide (TPR) repeat protein
MERTDRSGMRQRLSGQGILLILSLLTGAAGVVQAAESTLPAEDLPGLAAFDAAVAAGDDSKASAVGDELLASIKQRYRTDAGFLAFVGRLQAADFLAQQMHQQLSRATKTLLSNVAGEPLAGKTGGKRAGVPAIAPARQFLQASADLFARPVVVESLNSHEKSFLARYYDLKLRSCVTNIARAGQALAIAEPSFQGTHDYVLVLPLLHASEGRPVNTAVLPSWMNTPEQLAQLADSCLLSFELPFSAMGIARKAAEAKGLPFAEIDFYRKAAKQCDKSHAHVAVDCLNKAAELLSGNDRDTRVGLSFDIVQLWLDSGNYQLAAGEARRTLQMEPNEDDFGRATWLYYYALSRANSSQEILLSIDQALKDGRCEPYKIKLMYIQWWALRRQRDQGARVAALEHELLERYGSDPIVAPILLSRATDLLASQAYDDARLVLGQLAEKFPSTKAAEQAKRMLAKLGSVKGGM